MEKNSRNHWLFYLSLSLTRRLCNHQLMAAAENPIISASYHSPIRRNMNCGDRRNFRSNCYFKLRVVLQCHISTQQANDLKILSILYVTYIGPYPTKSTFSPRLSFMYILISPSHLSISLPFPIKIFQATHLSNECCMPSPSHLPRPHRPTNIQSRTQIIKQLVMQFSPSSRYFHSPRSTLPSAPPIAALVVHFAPILQVLLFI
jgi:hypothetical protein